MALGYYFSSGYLFKASFEFKYYWLYLAFFSLVLVFSFLIRFFGGKYKNTPEFKSIFKKGFWLFFVLGVLGFLSVFFRYEGIPLLGLRIWTFLILTGIIVFLGYLLFWRLFVFSKVIERYQEKQRKEKWLKYRG